MTIARIALDVTRAVSGIDRMRWEVLWRYIVARLIRVSSHSRSADFVSSNPVERFSILSSDDQLLRTEYCDRPKSCDFSYSANLLENLVFHYAYFIIIIIYFFFNCLTYRLLPLSPSLHNVLDCPHFKSHRSQTFPILGPSIKPSLTRPRVLALFRLVYW